MLSVHRIKKAATLSKRKFKAAGNDYMDQEIGYTEIPVKYEGHHDRLELNGLSSIQLLIVPIPSFYLQTKNYLILKSAFLIISGMGKVARDIF